MRELFMAPPELFPAKVTSVNEANLTIDVEPIGEPELFDVRLKAGVDNVTDGIVHFPKVGSIVLCSMVANSKQDAVVMFTSSVDKVLMFGGENGGLTITPKLVDELNKTNELLNALLDVIKGAPVMEPGNGSPSALQTQLNAVLADKELGDYSEIENEKVKH